MCEAEEKASLGTLSLHPYFLSKHRNIPSSCPWAAEEPQKMSKHANEAGNKENVNSSPALHVKNQRTIYLHFQTKQKKKLPRHENIENNKLPTSLGGVGGKKWIHMKVVLIAGAAPLTAGRRMQAK